VDYRERALPVREVLTALVAPDVLRVVYELLGYAETRTEGRVCFERALSRRYSVQAYGLRPRVICVAEAMDVSLDEAERIVTAARIHDLGKVTTRDATLMKPGKLTDLVVPIECQL
jgi:hypothetical protein